MTLTTPQPVRSPAPVAIDALVPIDGKLGRVLRIIGSFYGPEGSGRLVKILVGDVVSEVRVLETGER